MIKMKISAFAVVVLFMLSFMIAFTMIVPERVSATFLWYDSDWQYRKLITINESKVDDLLINFPVLIYQASDTELATNAQDDGDDILFVLYSDNTTKLNHEIESFNGATGELTTWVNITSLSDTTDTKIWMYYGNPNCSSQQNVESTWDGDYVMVQHMNGTSYLLIDDSTSNNNDVTGISAGVPAFQQTGRAGYGVNFSNGNQYLNFTNDVLSVPPMTIEIWSYPTNFDDGNYIISNGASLAKGGFTINYDTTSGKHWILMCDDALNHARYLSSSVPANLHDWNYDVCSWDGTASLGRYQFNKTGGPLTNADQAISATSNLFIGANSFGFRGIVDEVRLSKVVRNNSWLNATYDSINSPTTFHFFGLEEDVSDTIPIQSNPSPINGATGQSLTPQLAITIADPNGDTMNVTFSTNVTGIWGTIGTNSSVANGTYSWTNASMNNYGTKYWWNVSINDATDQWSNATYYFTTTPINTSVDPIIPYNHSTNPLTITTSSTADLDNVTLYYRFSNINSTSIDYMNELTLTDVFLNVLLDYPNQMVIYENFSYVASFFKDTLMVLNISNISSATEISNITDGTYLDNVHDVDITSDGNYVYTLTYEDPAYLCIYDVSDPTSMARVNETTTAHGTGMYLDISDDDNFLYVTTKTYINIYNITDKANYQLDLVKEFNTNVTDEIWYPQIYHDGTTLYVGHYDGLLIYNVSDKTNPVFVQMLTNITVQPLIYSNDGFDYLVFASSTNIGVLITYIDCYNISSNNATNPTWMFTSNTLTAGSNYSGMGIIMNGYFFLMKGNAVTVAYNNGIMVWNWTDTTKAPTFLSMIYGDGAPNYMNFCHSIKANRNGSTRAIYAITQNDDSFLTLTPDWFTMTFSAFGGSWTKFGVPDVTYPFSFSFTFPNGTGYYEFYSIGKKTGSPDETEPVTSDATCNYILFNSSIVFSFENPINGSTGIPFYVNITWNLTIENNLSYLMNWSIETAIGTGYGYNDTNGSKQITLIRPIYNTSYTVWVNASDSTSSTKATYWFMTYNGTRTLNIYGQKNLPQVNSVSATVFNIIGASLIISLIMGVIVIFVKYR